MHTMRGIQSKFKLKDDKLDTPYVYLGAELSTLDNDQGKKLLAMLYDK